MNEYLDYLYELYPPSYYKIVKHGNGYKVTLYDKEKVEYERLNLHSCSRIVSFDKFIKKVNAKLLEENKE